MEEFKQNSSSFEFIPAIFKGIKTSTFGSTQQNPFFRLKEIILDPSSSWTEKTEGLRYLQHIPYIDCDSHSIECALNILQDNSFPIEDRYFFFSNNQKYIKLNHKIVNACHVLFFKNFQKYLEYRINSAQFILTQCAIENTTPELLKEVEEFLISIVKDQDYGINYRAECADILDRVGLTDEGKKVGKEVIDELSCLGDLKSIYSNKENVHFILKEDIVNTLKRLISTSKNKVSIDIVTERIRTLCEGCPISIQTKVMNSYNKILIDSARYEGLTLTDILLLIWERIPVKDKVFSLQEKIINDQRYELEQRFMDELYEMNETCSSGRLTRLMNVLSGGFFEDLNPVRITFEEQLRNNVFGRYTALINELPMEEKEILMMEIGGEGKENVKDFIELYSLRDELREEFKEYLSEEKFEEVYKKAEEDYFGI